MNKFQTYNNFWTKFDNIACEQSTNATSWKAHRHETIRQFQSLYHEVCGHSGKPPHNRAFLLKLFYQNSAFRSLIDYFHFTPFPLLRAKIQKGSLGLKSSESKERKTLRINKKLIELFLLFQNSKEWINQNEESFNTLISMTNVQEEKKKTQKWILGCVRGQKFPWWSN